MATLLGKVQTGLLRGNTRARYYRLLGNKLKETCDLNTGIRVREQHAREEWVSKTGIRVRDINQPNIWERPEKGTSTQENLTPQGTKVIIGSRKEGTPGIPRYIIGDRPKRELVYMPKHSSSKKRAEKENSIIGWAFDSIRKYESYSTGKKKTSTEERMRYIIYYRQNVDNILAWKIIHNRLLG